MLNPEAVIPFHAYRRLDGEWPMHELAPSLVHFYEAEKFRSTHEALRQEVMAAPTPRAARKITRRHQELWRADWRRVRGAVLRAGLAMQLMQSKEVRVAVRATYDKAIEVGAIKRVGGLPGSFVAQEVAAMMDASAVKNALRVGIFVLDGYAPEDFEQRMNALFQRGVPLSATLYVGEEASRAPELWCMRNAVPIRYVGDPQRRLRAEDHKDLARRISTLIVCAPGQRKAVREIVTTQRRSRIKVLDLGLKVRALSSIDSEVWR